MSACVTQKCHSHLTVLRSRRYGLNALQVTQTVTFLHDLYRLGDEDEEAEDEAREDAEQDQPPNSPSNKRIHLYLDGEKLEDLLAPGTNGRHIVHIPSPTVPGHHRISIKTIDRYGWQQEDSTTISVNTRAYRLLKWALSLPFLVAGGVALLLGESNASMRARQNHLDS